jgi:hypothetical protein
MEGSRNLQDIGRSDHATSDTLASFLLWLRDPQCGRGRVPRQTIGLDYISASGGATDKLRFRDLYHYF